MDLFVVGSVAIDVVDTPRASSGRVLGGSATYAAYAASFFSKVGIVSVVGSDFPEEYLEVLRRRGINLDGLAFAPGPSFFWHGRYAEDSNERVTVKVCPNVLGEFDGSVPESYLGAPCVLLGNCSPSLQLSVVNQLAPSRLVFADTMDHWITGSCEGVRELIRRSTGIFVNEFEATLLTDAEPQDAARKLHEMGPQVVVVKLGTKGSILSWRGGAIHVPVYKVKDVLDATGAGDCFAGGFMGYLSGKPELSRKVLVDACVYGTVMASFCIESFSLNRLERVSPAEIEERRRDVLERTR